MGKFNSLQWGNLSPYNGEIYLLTMGKFNSLQWGNITPYNGEIYLLTMGKFIFLQWGNLTFYNGEILLLTMGKDVISRSQSFLVCFSGLSIDLHVMPIYGLMKFDKSYRDNFN